MSKLKTLTKYQFPEYVRDEYKVFVSFIEAYHEWLEATEAKIGQIIDIDEVTEEFLIHYKNEINHLGMAFPYVDNKFILRHIKNFYLSKGTEESYITLFRILYNKEVFLKFPETQTLKTSDGKWIQRYSIFVEEFSGNGLDLDDKVVKCYSVGRNIEFNLTIENVRVVRQGGGISSIYLANGGSGYTAENTTITIREGGGHSAAAIPIIENGSIVSIRIVNMGDGYVTTPQIIISGDGNGAEVDKVVIYTRPTVYEMDIDRNFYGSISVGDEIRFGTFLGKIKPTINSFKIIDGGKNFKLGQIFEIKTHFGTGAIVKVTRINKDGSIRELKFIRFGFGYVSDFNSISIIPQKLSRSWSDSAWIPRESETHLTFVTGNGQLATITSGSLNKVYVGYEVVNSFNGEILGIVSSVDVARGEFTFLSPIPINSYSATIYDPLEILKYQQFDETADMPSTGYILRENYFDNTAQTSTAFDYVGTIAREFFSDNRYSGDTNNRAIVEFKIGAICKYPGYYDASDGKLSDDFKLQDSKFYQKYSVLIQSDKPLVDYKDAVMKYVHPAGVALYGEYNMMSKINLGIKLKALLSAFNIRVSDGVNAHSGHSNPEGLWINQHRITKVINDYSVLLWGNQKDRTANYDGSYNSATGTRMPIKHTKKIVNDQSSTLLGLIPDQAHPLSGTLLYNGNYIDIHKIIKIVNDWSSQLWGNPKDHTGITSGKLNTFSGNLEQTKHTVKILNDWSSQLWGNPKDHTGITSGKLNTFSGNLEQAKHTIRPINDQTNNLFSVPIDHTSVYTSNKYSLIKIVNDSATNALGLQKDWVLPHSGKLFYGNSWINENKIIKVINNTTNILFGKPKDETNITVGQLIFSIGQRLIDTYQAYTVSEALRLSGSWTVFDNAYCLNAQINIKYKKIVNVITNATDNGYAIVNQYVYNYWENNYANNPSQIF